MNKSDDPEPHTPAEPVAITGESRWEDVTLPDAVSEADLDAALVSALKPPWRKTAMVVGSAAVQCRERVRPGAPEILAARLQAPAQSGRIDIAGDIGAWRHSEVKLKD